MNFSTVRRLVLALCVSAATTGVAHAQTQVKLTDANATTLRGGTFATTNFGDEQTLETRASSDPEYDRRALLKFDTDTTIPAGSAIQSATLTLTVAGGNASNRQLSAYHVPTSYDETAATWLTRKSGAAWAEQGGDTGARYAVGAVSSTVGSKVTMDVTALVQAIVRGDFGSSRYTRILLVDEGASGSDSYKQFYSDEATDATVRPTLTVTLGSSSTTTPPPDTITTSSTLRVLHWNTHHGGYGTDGKYDTDRVATWIVKMKPDIISLNEIEYYTGWGNEDQPAKYAALLKAKTGITWYYKFATATGATKGNGNLILSRFPLSSAKAIQLSYDRVAVQVTVSVNGKTINFFSTHLDDNSSTQRTTEIAELKANASVLAQQRIIAGDFNAYPGAAEIPKMTADYYDSWAEAKADGTALAYAGNEAGNTRNSRIDYIFSSHAASGLALKSAQVYDTRDANGVMPSDHRPLVAVFAIK
jgi:endonuclease/exonuclease/phosphatase family metal-dependent hydrolase